MGYPIRYYWVLWRNHAGPPAWVKLADIGVIGRYTHFILVEILVLAGGVIPTGAGGADQHLNLYHPLCSRPEFQVCGHRGLVHDASEPAAAG